jgi:hypothetical protein
MYMCTFNIHFHLPCLPQVGSFHEFDLFLTYLYLSSNKCAKYRLWIFLTFPDDYVVKSHVSQAGALCTFTCVQSSVELLQKPVWNLDGHYML